MRAYNNIEVAAADAADSLNIILHAHSYRASLSKDELKDLNGVLKDIRDKLTLALNSAGIYAS